MVAAVQDLYLRPGKVLEAAGVGMGPLDGEPRLAATVSATQIPES
jgi:hypothetical protein